MGFRLAAIAWFIAIAPIATAAAAAGQCALDHAAYEEPVSGATMQFRQKDASADAALTTGLFTLRLPGIDIDFQGDITGNAGANARPDGAIGRPCADDESDDDGSGCWLWTGNVYALGDATAGLVARPDMPAPAAILLSDFGRALAYLPDFAKANRAAFDVFTLTGCKP